MKCSETQDSTIRCVISEGAGAEAIFLQTSGDGAAAAAQKGLGTDSVFFLCFPQPLIEEDPDLGR